MGVMKLAVLFPGIGYHCDKPLLYYAAKLAKAAKYEVLPVSYTGFPEKVRGNADKMRECLDIAWSQANELLESVDWSVYNNILFIGLRKPSDLSAAMPSPFTEPLTRGRRQTRLWKRAGREASRYTRQKAQTTPWKPGM